MTTEEVEETDLMEYLKTRVGYNVWGVREFEDLIAP